jgi:hypothetical protein
MRLLPVLFLVVSVAPVQAQLVQAQLLDPRTRDEDISGTRVTVDVSTTSEGLYLYTYGIVAPTTNKGSVARLLIDVRCTTPADRTGLPDQPDVPGFLLSASDDNRHSPVNLSADSGVTSVYSITANNWILWGSYNRPGESAVGMKVLSTMPPKPRLYELGPSWDTGYPWNYEGIEEDTPDIPWIPDFTVYGTTQGPSCPGDPPPPPTSSFPGTAKPGETEAVNALLTYSAPLTDRFHLPAGTQSVAVTIHYGKDIDPKSFKVEPQSNKVRKLFTPKPDSSETVFLPVQSGKNKYTLSVQEQFTPPGSVEDAIRGRGRRGPAKDIDVFEIRVDASAPPP